MNRERPTRRSARLDILDELRFRTDREHEASKRSLDRFRAAAQEAVAGRLRALHQRVEVRDLELQLRRADILNLPANRLWRYAAVHSGELHERQSGPRARNGDGRLRQRAAIDAVEPQFAVGGPTRRTDFEAQQISIEL